MAIVDLKYIDFLTWALLILRLLLIFESAPQ